MTPTAWAWLVVAFPLLGTIVIGLGWRLWPGRVAGACRRICIMYSIGCTPPTGSFISGHPYANAPTIRSRPLSSLRYIGDPLIPAIDPVCSRFAPLH